MRLSDVASRQVMLRAQQELIDMGFDHVKMLSLEGNLGLQVGFKKLIASLFAKDMKGHSASEWVAELCAELVEHYAIEADSMCSTWMDKSKKVELIKLMLDGKKIKSLMLDLSDSSGRLNRATAAGWKILANDVNGDTEEVILYK